MTEEKKYSLKAIIYDKKGNVLSIAENSYVKTHPYMYKLALKHNEPCKIYLHAEIAAIIKCKDLTKAHRIFISRVGRSNKFLNAKPCKICQEAISLTNIKIIEHT